MLWLGKISINIDNPNSEIATLNNFNLNKANLPSRSHQISLTPLPIQHKCYVIDLMCESQQFK